MHPVLLPIEQISSQLEHVIINEAAIKTFADNVNESDLQDTEFTAQTLLENASSEEQVAFAFVYNTLNFSYWSDPKWTIEIDGSPYDGSAGMLRALRKGVLEGYDLLSSRYLSTLDKETFATILKGNVPIPLFDERARFLNQLGEHITSRYNSSFTRFVDEAGWRAEDIVLKLANELPEIFDDSATYKNHRIHFYKRAQLVPAHLHDLQRIGLIKQPVQEVEALTAFADYKVPQLMRSLGILTYKLALAKKVDNFIELPSGSNEELEIRIATVWANELCTRMIKKQIPQATAVQVDGLFWFAGQKPKATIKPYHRTRTTWY